MSVMICSAREFSATLRPVDVSTLSDAEAEEIVRQVAATFRQLQSAQRWEDVFPLLSARAANVLHRHKAVTVGDVAQLMMGVAPKRYGKAPAGAGLRSIVEIRAALAEVR